MRHMNMKAQRELLTVFYKQEGRLTLWNQKKNNNIKDNCYGKLFF